MITRRLLMSAPLALAATRPAFAQTAPVRVRLTMPQGAIVLELATDKAPVTAANFLRYVDQKRYDGATFYRVSHPPGQLDYGLVQGGLQNDPARILKPIAHESTAKTGLTHKDGTVSMGRHAPGSATSDFFICVGEQTYLDADPKTNSPGFAAFAQVVEGMDVVKAILAMPQSAAGGVGAMKAEMLARPIRILSARREP